MNDAELAALLVGRAETPYPGTWQDTPFTERRSGGVCHALVAIDPDVTALGVRREDRSLRLLPEQATPRLVNTGAEAFAAFTRLCREAAAEADAYEDEDDGSDEAVDRATAAGDALTGALLAEFETLDPAAVADENSFRHIAAEELGYGMGG
ncbi:SUKH-4 family immunity protein [Kitasatospora sp. DSM 101779]|uniref:SUKH-4 family immunity protein n=1 Tax=Kitasatospora sp. DSM 101779 TaxID=2853165 RepID=UPI0021D93483|nr:SUKH-4 family immunity protein [Kitasatospora sp. DSM 101779]MCU7826682.1 SUKH-4 family immunity protein [Kitasatospora sp. DSM 101779]